MNDLKKNIELALEVLDPTNTKATYEEKQKAFLIVKEALNLLFE